VEVHAAFTRDLRTSLHEQNEAMRVVVLLDATSLHDRRSAEGVKTRLELWQTVLRGTADTVLTCGG
jgi:hypothetical protein